MQKHGFSRQPQFKVAEKHIEAKKKLSYETATKLASYYL